MQNPFRTRAGAIVREADAYAPRCTSGYRLDRRSRTVYACMASWRPAIVGTLLILGGCGGSAGTGVETGGTGGGAGDGDGDTIDPVGAIEPFVGLYDITGNWSGVPSVPNDEATLVIRAPDDEGRSEVTILDFDDTGGGNCSFSSNVTGLAAASPITGQIFLDSLPDFPTAILTLDSSGSVLTIRGFTDLNDIDNDGNRRETQDYEAARIPGLTETDVSICTFGT